MLYTQMSSDMWFWIFGALSSSIFAVITGMRLKGTSNYIRSSTMLVVGIMAASAVSYLLWLIPLFFTRNAELYQYFFITGFAFSHAALTLAAALLFYLTLHDRQTLRRALSAAATILSAISVVLHAVSLQGSVELQQNEVVYMASDIAAIMLAILFLPLAGIGVFLIKQGISTKSFSTKFRAFSLGIFLVLLAIGLALNSVAQVTEISGIAEPLSGVSPYYYVLFLAINIVILALRYVKNGRGLGR